MASYPDSQNLRGAVPKLPLTMSGKLLVQGMLSSRPQLTASYIVCLNCEGLYNQDLNFVLIPVLM